MPNINKFINLLLVWGAHTVPYYVIVCVLAIPVALILPLSYEEGAVLAVLATLLFVAGRLVAGRTGARVATGAWIWPLIVVLAFIWGDWNLVEHSPYYRNLHVDPSAYIWHHYLTLTTDSDCGESECLGKLASDIFVWSVAYSFGALSVFSRSGGKSAGPGPSSTFDSRRTPAGLQWLGYTIFIYFAQFGVFAADHLMASASALAADPAAHALVRTLIFPLIGLAGGFLLVRRIGYAGARWVWVAPTGVLSVLLVRLAFFFHSGPDMGRHPITFWGFVWARFFSTHCGMAIGFCELAVLFAYPLYFAVGYSIAAFIRLPRGALSRPAPEMAGGEG